MTNPKPDDVVLGGQGNTSIGAVVLGGVEGAKHRLATATDRESYKAACKELVRYPGGDTLLRQFAILRCVAITKHPVGLFLIHHYQQVKHPRFNSLYWHPELDSAFVPKRLRGKPLGEFLQFEDAFAKGKEITTPETPLLWGIAPWVKADYGWLPPDEKPTEWQNLTEGNPIDSNGQVIRRAGLKKLQSLGVTPEGDPDHLVVNRAYPMSAHPMRLWFIRSDAF